MIGLAKPVKGIFDDISRLECIKPYILVGGTALSLQINHRNSEDLDFMCWRTGKVQRMEVDWSSIEKELAAIGAVESRDILDINHVVYIVSGVKLSFYACERYSPVQNEVGCLNNLKLADLTSIMAMKMEVLMRRTAFRDYYDIYAILKEGICIHDGIRLATKYSGHLLKTKNLLAMLSRGDRFAPEISFKELEPRYNVTSADIEQCIKGCLLSPNTNIK